MDGTETNKCSNCATGFKGLEADAPFSECVTAVDNCKVMNTTEGNEDKCSECLVGFTTVGDEGLYTECTCEAEKIYEGPNSEKVCVASIIENCSVYADAEKCETCLTEYELATD